MLKTYYVITMWSGGKAAKKWVSDAEPELLPEGNGISFINVQSKLRVKMIGSISIETYESGRQAMEAISGASNDEGPPSKAPAPSPATPSRDKNRLF